MSGKIYNFEETAPATKSVYEFISEVNSTLGRHSGRIEGEVTSLKNSYATAIYFSIKDTTQDALLNCVIWRSTYNQNSVDLKEGDKIIVTGTPEIYAPKGSFSLKVQTIEYAGEGALKKSYDELRKKLTDEGLLAASRKRELPDYPKKIGVITSRSGVVIQDFNSNLGRYGFETTMVDSRVEGKDAIHEILAALRTMAKQDIEVLVIIRGGGSWESLQAFNTESVVRAIAGFTCPVLTGIGHDVDVTLSELVADRGVSTPTAVAEALNETWDTLTSSISEAQTQIMSVYERRLVMAARLVDTNRSTLLRRYDQQLSVGRGDVTKAAARIQMAYRTLEKTITEATTTVQVLVGVMKTTIQTTQNNLAAIEVVVPKHFKTSLTRSLDSFSVYTRQLVTEQGRALVGAAQALVAVEHTITLSDPARTLQQGYSLSYVNGTLLRSVADAKAGVVVETKLADGNFTSEIKTVL